MFLFVGLGNPGKEYSYTRHNAGFMLLDYISNELSSGLWQQKNNSHYTKCSFYSNKLLLVKPQTYMNLSGKSVKAWQQFYKIDLNQIIVAHDDVDLAFGKIKVKTGGGSGGHNGIKSIDQYIGTNYIRLRIGVGRPQHQAIDTASHVLGKFDNIELEQLSICWQKIYNNLELLLAGNHDIFLSKVNQN
ncbi:MAG: aminoacyl-tRNA hydrolase [Pseudomonadota bacterium]